MMTPSYEAEAYRYRYRRRRSRFQFGCRCHHSLCARSSAVRSSLHLPSIMSILLLLLVHSFCTTLVMAATLSGYTFLDANLDGMRATGWDQLKEYGIPNISLWLFDCNNMPIKVSETDELGYYVFEDLEVGSSYYINAQLPSEYEFGPVWIGNVGDEELTSPGVDNAIDPAIGSTPCFEMTEEEGVVSIGMTLLGGSDGSASSSSSSSPTLRPSSATSFDASISPSILSSMKPEFTTTTTSSSPSPPPTTTTANVPTVTPSSMTQSNSPMQSSSSSSSSSSPSMVTLMPSSSSVSSTTTSLSPTLPGIQYATPSIPLQMKIIGIDQLEDVDAWLSCTEQYIESYFNDASNDGVFDAIIELSMDKDSSASVFKTRQRQLRGKLLQQEDDIVLLEERHRTTKHVGRRRQQGSNSETSAEISYNQQSTYKTSNPQQYDDMYVASIPFMDAVDRGRYIAALWELSPYYKDVTSIEPPKTVSQSNSDSDNSSGTSTGTSSPKGQEDMIANDTNGGSTSSVDNISQNSDITQGPMLYVIIGCSIVGVAILASAMVFIVKQQRKQKRNTMDHEYMSTVGNGPTASSGSTRREVTETDGAMMDDLESRNDEDVNDDETRIAATAGAVASATAIAASRSSQRRRSSKRSRKAAKSYNGGSDRRVNDSSLTPIPENPLSPSSSISGATATVVLNILAPPGKLGVIVDNPPQGGCAYVVEIRESCPIRDEIHIDDRIIAVDDKDVQRMSATNICKLLERKSRNTQRKITVLREASSSHFDGTMDDIKQHNGSLHLPIGAIGGRDSNSDHAQADTLPEKSTSQCNSTREERIEIVAPSGRLGVVLLSPDPPEAGPAFISDISNDSPLLDKIQTGDKIIAIDDKDVRDMSAKNVSQLLGSKSNKTERKIIVLRQITNYAAASGADQKDTRITIVAPAGKLGVIVATNPGSGLAYVSEIKESSPIKDEIRVGDQILEVDGEDVSKMKAIHISMLIGSKSKNFERVITVSRDGGRLL